VSSAFKVGDRVVLTGTRPALKLRGQRGVVEGFTRWNYVQVRLDGEKSNVWVREFPEDQFTPKEVYDSPLMKALR
jgi:hypothetical protein